MAFREFVAAQSAQIKDDPTGASQTQEQDLALVARFVGDILPGATSLSLTRTVTSAEGEHFVETTTSQLGEFMGSPIRDVFRQDPWREERADLQVAVPRIFRQASAWSLVAVLSDDGQGEYDPGTVLAISGRQAEGYSDEQMEENAGLLVRQLALLEQVRSSQISLSRQVDFNARAFGDLAHQVGTPVTLALEQIRNLDLSKKSESRTQVARVLGLLRKVEHAQRSALHFGELARGRRIDLDIEFVDASRLRRILILACDDAELARSVSARLKSVAVRPIEGVVVSLDRGALSRALNEDEGVLVDETAVNQILASVLDNAVKYSFDGETVKVVARRFGPTLRIAVRNRGLKVEERDVRFAFQHEWRSQAARHFTGDGQGIGLFVAKGLARSLPGGEVSLIPTDGLGFTECRIDLTVRRAESAS